MFLEVTQDSRTGPRGRTSCTSAKPEPPPSKRQNVVLPGSSPPRVVSLDQNRKGKSCKEVGWGCWTCVGRRPTKSESEGLEWPYRRTSLFSETTKGTEGRVGPLRRNPSVTTSTPTHPPVLVRGESTLYKTLIGITPPFPSDKVTSLYPKNLVKFPTESRFYRHHPGVSPTINRENRDYFRLPVLLPSRLFVPLIEGLSGIYSSVHVPSHFLSKPGRLEGRLPVVGCP